MLSILAFNSEKGEIMLLDAPKLQKIALFDGLTPEQLRFIMENARQRVYRRFNEAIVHEHDQGETFYVILSGTVKVSTTLANGKEVFLALLASGRHLWRDEPH